MLGCDERKQRQGMITTASFNPRNFGQYAAGLGAAELAHLAGHRVKIGFRNIDPISTEIQITTDAAVDWSEILDGVKRLTVSDQKRSLYIPADSKSKNKGPITLTLPFADIELDWWFDDFLSKTVRCPFSSQPAESKFRNISREIRKLNGLIDLQAAFDARAKDGTILYFDRRGVPSRGSLGYSTDMADEAVPSYPYVEILAAIGMQTFRPQAIRIDREDTLRYFLWEKGLPRTEAALAVLYPWDGLPGMKMFTTLTKLNSQSSDCYYDWALSRREWFTKTAGRPTKFKEKYNYAKAI